MYNENKGIVITISNTKGGCGKSTFASLISQYLAIKKKIDESKGIKRKEVGILDLDKPQYTSRTYFMNRKKFFQDELINPILLDFNLTNDSSYEEFEAYIEDLKLKFDYIIIDGGGHYDRVSEMIIKVANILITPVLNTLVDFNVLFQYNNIKNEIILGSFVRFIRAHKIPNKKLFWYVVPNKCSPIISEYSDKCFHILKSMSDIIGYKVTDSITDRYIYSQSFDMGLNIFDMEITKYFIINQNTLNAARHEVLNIINSILYH